MERRRIMLYNVIGVCNGQKAKTAGSWDGDADYVYDVYCLDSYHSHEKMQIKVPRVIKNNNQVVIRRTHSLAFEKSKMILPWPIT
jgi:hypothetical protein